MFRSAFSMALVGSLVLSGMAMAACSPSAEPALATQAPSTAEAVPLFPGLTLVGEEPVTFGGLTDGGRPYTLIDGKKRTYATNATAEQVYAFYQQRLGGKTEWDSSDDHTNIGANGVTPVMRTRYPHDLEDKENIVTERMISSATQRSLLQAHRPPSDQGDWLRDGGFTWVAKDARGAPTAFHVEIVDASIDTNWTTYTPRTEVAVIVSRYGPTADR